MPAGNSKKATGKRVPGRPFQKGQSGNPTGRPKIPNDIKDMLRAATPDACKLLCDTINDPEAKLDLRVRCCEIVFDRVYGRPPQAVEVDAHAIPQVVIVGDVLD